MGKQSWICVLAVALSLSAVAQASAQQAEEQELMQATNQDRAEHGLGPLQWDPALAQAAAAHAQLMAQQPALSHQYPGEPDLVTRAGQSGAHFRSIAENIAVAPTPEAVEREWMNSTPHRANILDPHMNAIGVALVKRGGAYYAVEDFSNRVAELGPQKIEQQVGALLKQRGIDPSGPVEDARQTCEMPHGSAGGSSPKFIMRWEGSDLSKLPPALEQRLQTGQYHKAAVGACDSAQPEQGFTTYRVAVMLY